MRIDADVELMESLGCKRSGLTLIQLAGLIGCKGGIAYNSRAPVSQKLVIILTPL